MAETPWSVKGVDRKAREAAKRAAHAEGRTLGAWLNDAILGRWTAGKPTSTIPSGAAADQARPAPPQSPTDLERRLDRLEDRQTALARDMLAAMMMLRAELRDARASAETRETSRALGEAARALESAASAGPGSARPNERAEDGLRELIDAAKSRIAALEREMEALRDRSGPPAVFEPPPAPRKDVGSIAFVGALILGGVFVAAISAILWAGGE